MYAVYTCFILRRIETHIRLAYIFENLPNY